MNHSAGTAHQFAQRALVRQVARHDLKIQIGKLRVDGILPRQNADLPAPACQGGGDIAAKKTGRTCDRREPGHG